MIDKINQPQSKLQQQSQQANIGLNKPIQQQRPGQPQTATPEAQLPQPKPTAQPELAADQQQLQQEQKGGFKAAIQRAKQKTIDKGKQHLMDRVTGGQDEFNQPQQNTQQPGNNPLQEPPKPSIPESTRPTVNRPDTSNRPQPQPPTARAPRFKAPPRPKLR